MVAAMPKQFQRVCQEGARQVAGLPILRSGGSRLCHYPWWGVLRPSLELVQYSARAWNLFSTPPELGTCSAR
eukprot:5405204-Amphidinium_carterae.2